MGLPAIPLLDTKTYPTIMETSITQPRMVNPGTERIFIRQDTDWGGMEVRSQDAAVTMDSTAARESIGMGNWRDSTFVRHFAEQGERKLEEGNYRRLEEGRAMEESRATPVQLEQRREASERSKAVDNTVLAFVPSEPVDIDVRRGGVDIEHRPTEVNIDWENTETVPYRLIRGTVDFNIVRKAYVDVTYLGDPIYFPESAAPEFSARA